MIARKPSPSPRGSRKAPAKSLPELPTFVTGAKLARLFGVSTRTISDLTARGIIAHSASGYEMDESTKRYCKHLRAVASRHVAGDGSLDVTAERAKLARAQTKEAELRIAARSGALVPAEEVGEAMSVLVRTLRQHTLAIPDRIALRIPSLGAAERLIIEEAVFDALSTIAKAGADMHAADELEKESTS